MIVAVFEWGDGYAEIISYPKGVRGLVHSGKRPNSLKVLVKDAKTCDAKLPEWFNDCYAALCKGG